MLLTLSYILINWYWEHYIKKNLDLYLIVCSKDKTKCIKHYKN